MAELNINGRMSVKNLKKQFKEAFGASLRVYNGKEIADEEARIASIRTDEGQDGTLEMRGNMKVGGFEAKMLETYGLRVKVADAADLQLVPDDITIASVAKYQGMTTPAAPGIDINTLIDAALADGVLSEKERAVLVKKAVAMGTDADEFEILLDAKILEKGARVESGKAEKPKEVKKTEPKLKFSETLQKLYDNAIKDGILSDNEAQIIIMMAQKEGMTLTKEQLEKYIADEKKAKLDAIIKEDLQMVKVEGGMFEREGNMVVLDGFQICKFQVTQRLWECVMYNNPSDCKGERRPVESVSYEDVQKFIGKLNERTGKQFRLPTEAEWEFAARGGNNSKGFKYAGSNNPGDVAWFDDNSGGKTHPVGEKSPNELGLYDMSGNVWEWCQDWYGNYPTEMSVNPKGPNRGSYRVNRGGSWYDSESYCAVSFRDSDSPSRRNRDLGFRLAL